MFPPPPCSSGLAQATPLRPKFWACPDFAHFSWAGPEKVFPVCALAFQTPQVVRRRVGRRLFHRFVVPPDQNYGNPAGVPGGCHLGVGSGT